MFGRVTIALGAGGVLVVCAAFARQPHSQVRLNRDSLLYVEEMIQEGRFIGDKRNQWGEHQPSAIEENEFIRLHGFAEYAKWHLAVDESHASDAKARYKFICGDLKVIHRCALLAAKNRARQYGYEEIATTCDRLLLTAKANVGVDHISPSRREKSVTPLPMRSGIH